MLTLFLSIAICGAAVEVDAGWRAPKSVEQSPTPARPQASGGYPSNWAPESSADERRLIDISEKLLSVVQELKSYKQDQSETTTTSSTAAPSGVAPPATSDQLKLVLIIAALCIMLSLLAVAVWTSLRWGGSEQVQPKQVEEQWVRTSLVT
mmetsp:Transcript_55280/g.121132  ORF Transcript_55280/g.121132 Transcript_55280/m.121132 type:complete len:151 (+) Transcript_55280:78-530(+)